MKGSVTAADVAAWATESLRLAEKPSVKYCFQHDDACWFSENAPAFRGERRTIEIDAAYLDSQAPVVRERLSQAGVRLGAILNAAFARE